MNDHRELLERMYAAFNARDIDAVLGVIHADVDWPNALHGGRIHGREEVRDYWTRQWAAIDPLVTPTAFRLDPDCRIAVQVRAVVRDRSGVLLSEAVVVHVDRFENGLIRDMEIRRSVAPTDDPR